MSEKLQEALAKFVEKTINLLEKGGNMAATEIPDVIQQFLMWVSVEASIFAALGAIFFFIGVKSLRTVISNYQDTDSKYFKKASYGTADFTGVGVFTNILGGAGTIVGGIMLVVNLHKLLFVIVAPKVYLIKYLSEFL